VKARPYYFIFLLDSTEEMTSLVGFQIFPLQPTYSGMALLVNPCLLGAIIDI
jgi:hypothetical protein